MIHATAEDGKAYLHDDATGSNVLILKAYVSPDGAKIRIVLPELTGYGHIKHFVDLGAGQPRYIEFTRHKRRK